MEIAKIAIVAVVAKIVMAPKYFKHADICYSVVSSGDCQYCLTKLLPSA
jgi:hypothetical protein